MNDNITIWNCPEAFCGGKLIKRTNNMDINMQEIKRTHSKLTC